VIDEAGRFRISCAGGAFPHRRNGGEDVRSEGKAQKDTAVS